MSNCTDTDLDKARTMRREQHDRLLAKIDASDTSVVQAVSDYGWACYWQGFTVERLDGQKRETVLEAETVREPALTTAHLAQVLNAMIADSRPLDELLAVIEAAR